MDTVKRQALIRRLRDKKLGKDEKYNNNKNEHTTERHTASKTHQQQQQQYACRN